MSTRAIYTFKGFGDTHHVFKHYDGYPTGAADALARAMQNAWVLPRYEPDEFAAAFVAGNKPGGGGVRLARKRTEYVDVSFGYTIEPDTTIPSLLKLTVHETCFRGGATKQTRIWAGPLVDFIAHGAAQLEQEVYA
jgi:hypothetical protein